MMVETHSLGHGSNLDLAVKSPAHAEGRKLIAVVGGGRGCALRVSGPATVIWLPLRGRLQIDATNADSVASPGELRVTEPDSRIHAIGRGNAIWLALLGHPAAWRAALGGLIEPSMPDPVLVPARHRASHAMRRDAVAFVRALDDRSRSDRAETLFEGLVELQRAFAPAILRCPGRTFAQRRQVFVRLQRVRNYLAANCHLDIDNEALARMASYSPWHFIRAFRSAYGETPHTYLVRQRLERAKRLLSASSLAIAEIALASGFENRCAFSRLFRQRFGVTAGAVRRGGYEVAVSMAR
ncbi:AraC family transcriptional regulator [Dokdonella soli]|uniref:AraC family transcriptional regulator n=1 Tax=Dokdonella soli TaxID=529810 RepID=UPI0031DEEC45